MQVRDWATVDYYDVLGVPRTASDVEIARAYRALAKQHHPDAAGDEERERFSEIATAYEVLSNPRQRYDYDDVRASVGGWRNDGARSEAAAPGGSATAPRPLVRWTRRKATVTIVAGAVCFVLGIVFSVFTLHVQAGDRADRAGRQRATAFVLATSTGRHQLSFTTVDGASVIVAEPARVNPGVLHAGDSLTLLYRPTNPRDVIVDETHFGRDFTYWFIAVKLLVCGPIIAAVGWRKRRTFVRA